MPYLSFFAKLWIKGLCMRNFFVLSPFFICVLFGIFYPFISPYDIYISDLSSIKLAPSFSHFFGTDVFGRDLFTRIAYAFRTSLFVGFFASLCILAFAIFYAFLARFFLRNFLLGILDAFLAFPSLLFIMLFQSFFSNSVFVMIVVIALGHFALLAKLLDTQISNIMLSDSYKNAIVLGGTKFTLFVYEILPACFSLLSVFFVLNIAHAISAEAMLSFFGLGFDLNQSSLGILLNDASKALFIGAWWLVIFPVLSLLCLILPLLYFAYFLQDKFGVKL